MRISLKEFKDEFKDNLLEIHWRHWTALGVASHVPPEKYWIVDSEATFISTLAIGLRDRRLLSVSLEWLIKNGEWVNFSRLKRIGKVFMSPFPGSNEFLLTPGTLKLTADTLRKFDQNAFSIKESSFQESEEAMLKEYKDFFGAFRIRKVVNEPQAQHPPLLQLLLRGIFGVDARVEVFIYLLIKDSGNSNSIAKDIFYDQKIVYRILEKWTRAGAVTKVAGKRAGDYSLKRRNEWLAVLGVQGPPGYVNWGRTFLFLDQVAKALSTPPWAEDEYLLSSLFRDVLDDVKSIGKALHLQIPEPASYPGPKYFVPFAQTILDILERLKGHDVGG